MRTILYGLSGLPLLGIVSFFAPLVCFYFRYPTMNSWLRYNPEELLGNVGLATAPFVYGLLLNVMSLVYYGIARSFRLKYNFTVQQTAVLAALLMMYVLTLTMDVSRGYIAWLLD